MASRSPGFESNPSPVSDLSVRHPTAVVVTIEGLGTNLIGAYGNSLCPTPHLDRFASQALVADQFWMDCCSADQILTSMWTGVHHYRRSQGEPAKRQGAMAPTLQSPGLMVTDTPRAIEHAKAILTGEAILVSSPERDQTAFCSLVEQALDHWIPRLDNLPWLWIHSQGLMRPWDAPYEYRCSMCDEGDPLPPRDTDPPMMLVDKNTDPDVIFGWACGAGAQAMVIDEVWEWLESALQQLELYPSCLLTLAGVLGFPLGEHRSIGYPSPLKQIAAPKLMHSESLHTPLILRPGNRLPLGVRFGPFLQPQHIGQLVNLWLEREGRGTIDAEGVAFPRAELGTGIEELIEMSSLRRDAWPAEFRAALVKQGDQSTLLVPAWGATWHNSDVEGKPGSSLYAMPDDRWQQNEIGSRAPETLDQMRILRDAWLADLEQSPSNIASLLSTMDESLWRQHR